MRFPKMGHKRKSTNEGMEEIDVSKDVFGPPEDADCGPDDPADPPGPLEAALAERDDWRSKCLYAAAEMDNVRRRARLDADEARRFATERLITDLLPVMDNFSRALDVAAQGGSSEALQDGVGLIHRQLAEALRRAGLQQIEAVGQPFDPNLHEAILQVEPLDGQPPHHVVEELQAGYRLYERVVRPTLVKITSG